MISGPVRVENEAFQDQNFSLKIYSHHAPYHIPLPKSQKELIWAQKSLRVLKLLRISIDSFVFWFHSNKGPL